MEQIKEQETKDHLEEQVSENMDMLFEFLTMEDEQEDIPEDMLLKTKKIIFELWEETGFTVLDVSTFVQTMEFVLNADRSMVEAMFERANIVITTKDRKKGRDAYYKRLLLKYHKESVRNTFQTMFEFLAKDEIKKIKENSSTEAIKELEETMGFEHLYWISSCALEDEELIGKLENLFPIEHVKMLIMFYLLYTNTEFDVIMNEPEKLRKDQNNVKPQQVLQENKKLKKNFHKAKKQEKNLKQELHQLQKEKKELKGEIYSLYNDSLLEIEKLKNDNLQMMEAFEEERQMYLQLIQQLTEEQHSQIDIDSENNFDLQGKKVAVVGGNRERHYSEIIEKYNGTISFVAEDDFNKIRGAVSESIGVFFLVELNGHHNFRETLSASKDYNVPFIFVNSKGTTSFDRELKRFILDLNS